METQAFVHLLNENTSNTIQLAFTLTPSNAILHPEGKWSPLQILEHIYLTDASVIRLLNKPSDTHHISENILGNEKLERFIVTLRDRKVDAPETLHPSGRFHDVAAFIEAFEKQRNQLSIQLTNGEIVIDNRIHKHPRLGEMTISDWLFFISHHTNRHLEQIKELLSHLSEH